ncbi:thioredoxin domain [Enterococcus phage BUCT630]
MKQRDNILDVTFKHCSFLDYNPEEYENCVFYLDPPYRKHYLIQLEAFHTKSLIIGLLN